MLVVYLGEHDPRGHVTPATTALVRWMARMKRWPVRRVVLMLRAGHGIDLPGQRYRWWS